MRIYKKACSTILFFLMVLIFPQSSMADSSASGVVAKMILIKGGCYQMGDTLGNGYNHEKPIHEVCVNDFYLGEHEVTQEQWQEVMGNNKSKFKGCGQDCPVENITFNDVQKYIKKLNESSGKSYRLSTEAEWEYAARERGKNVEFGTGKNIIRSDEANFNAKRSYKKPYSLSGVHRNKTVSVKSFSPNSLGLYDMAGNVFEFVSDRYNKKFYSESPRENPQGSSSGTNRICRGGSWKSKPTHVRASFRNYVSTKKKVSYIGFRLARTPG